MHGALLMINHAWRKAGIALPKVLNWGMTFLCVVICWVFFRAGSVHEAMQVLGSMADYQSLLGAHGKESRHLLEMIGMVALLAFVPNPLVLMKKFTANNKWLIVTAAMLVWAMWHLNNYSEFLYFQF